MAATYFSDIAPVQFAGPDTNNPLAYRYYDPKRVVLGKTMEEHLRIAVCYWHTFCSAGADMFGGGTWDRPWHKGSDPLAMAELKLEEAMSFVQKLGVPFYSFHDRDLAPDLGSMRDSQKAFAHMVDKAAAAQERTGVKLLWGTANLFSHPRYMAGASTNPDPEVFACASLQVRDALEATKKLGGASYVLWGGREGYDTLLNTDLKREFNQLGRFLNMVVEHKYKIGFDGLILIEPKPMEPSKHQYDFDVATVYGFLKQHGLEKEIQTNIECNHATLAGHSFEHEIATAVALGCFGSVDANRGDSQNGWDTDQFPNDAGEVAMSLYHVLKAGGFTKGGFNFDAKVRRQSVDALDLFYAHVGGVDTLAHGLLIAAKMIEDDKLGAFKDARYAGWNDTMGQQILNKELGLAAVADLAVAKNLEPTPVSGRQEMLETLVSRYL
jgi:xylose isomerase